MCGHTDQEAGAACRGSNVLLFLDETAPAPVFAIVREYFCQVAGGLRRCRELREA